MRLPIDTHVLLQAMAGDKKLSARAQATMLDADAVFVSAESIWEISIKSAFGKLDADVNELVAQMAEAGFRELPVTARYASAVHSAQRILPRGAI